MKSLNESLAAYSKIEIEYLQKCNICPRKCGVNRFESASGFCKMDAFFRVSAICVHKGEEPVISGEKGICNIFFPHCNLQCNYCQNFDISVNKYTNTVAAIDFDELINKICNVLDKTENIVGFVSPSHCLPQMLAIIRGIKNTGRNPIFVYNTNAYDRVESLKLLENIIDVYLPDFKYFDSDISFRYSQAKDYPEIAIAAIKEMYRQKGSTLITDDNGIAVSGMIIRHLILPGQVKQSVELLKFISEEISPSLHISLMSQYFPTKNLIGNQELNRNITLQEYQQVTKAFNDFGFYHGWIQEMESNKTYIPDFGKEDIFGD